MAEIGCGGVTVDSGLVAAWIQALGAADVDLLQRRLSWDEASVSNVGTFMTSLLAGQDDVDFDSIQALLRSSDPISDEQQAPNCSNAPFAELWQRIAFGAIESLARRLPEDVASWYRVRTSMWGQYRRVRDDLMRTLADRLSAIGQPVVWEEFNKRRTADQVILAHLGRDGSGHGPPKREIYCAFIEELRSDGLEELTRRYPVLRRHLSTAVGNWKQSSSEILTRVYGDRALLSERLGVPGDARLVGIEQRVLS